MAWFILFCFACMFIISLDRNIKGFNVVIFMYICFHLFCIYILHTFSPHPCLTYNDNNLPVTPSPLPLSSSFSFFSPSSSFSCRFGLSFFPFPFFSFISSSFYLFSFPLFSFFPFLFPPPPLPPSGRALVLIYIGVSVGLSFIILGSCLLFRESGRKRRFHQRIYTD